MRRMEDDRVLITLLIPPYGESNIITMKNKESAF